MPRPTSSSPLVHRLDSIFPLANEERAALAALPMFVREHAPHSTIVHEGDRPAQCCLVLEGMLCRHRTTRAGRRQILSLHLPGDIPDLQSLHLKVMDHSLSTITSAMAGFIAHEHLRSLIRQYPRLGSAFWRQTLIDAAIFREWMTGLGSRDAHQRLAHLLCELYVRMEALGLAGDHACPVPLTQGELGETLGLSNVHVNRVLQDLRGRNLIKLEHRRLTILDWQALSEMAEFDPLYLHQDPSGEA